MAFVRDWEGLCRAIQEAKSQDFLDVLDPFYSYYKSYPDYATSNRMWQFHEFCERLLVLSPRSLRLPLYRNLFRPLFEGCNDLPPGGVIGNYMYLASALSPTSVAGLCDVGFKAKLADYRATIASMEREEQYLGPDGYFEDFEEFAAYAGEWLDVFEDAVQNQAGLVFYVL